MAWDVVYAKQAENSLVRTAKSDKKMAVRIMDRIDEISRLDPYASTVLLSGVPLYRLRVGDYRVILDLQNGVMRVYVITVYKRARSYRLR